MKFAEKTPTTWLVFADHTPQSMGRKLTTLRARSVRIREVVGSNPIRSTRKGREIVDFTTFFQLISDIFGPVFVTYLSSTMIFLHFSQRYAVILSPFNLATRPPSAFRRWRCGPLCHNNAARLHTLPCIISAPQNGQFITIPLPSKFIYGSVSV